MHKIRMMTMLALFPLALSCSSRQIEVRAIQPAESTRMAHGEALTKGRMLFGRGEYALAADAFRKAARQNPESADAYNGLAASYDHLGRYDLSRRYYELALAFAPDDGRILRNFARSMLGQGNRLAARKLIAEAAALDAGSREAAIGDASFAQTATFATDGTPNGLAGTGSVTIALEDPASHRRDVIIPITQSSPSESTLFQRVAEAFVGGASRTEREVTVALDPPSSVREHDRSAASANLPRLHILNAVGRKHQAARMRRHLAEDGWIHASTGDARWKLVRSRVLFRPRDEAAARKLAASLPFKPRLLSSRHAPMLMLVLGRDAAPFDRQLLGSTAS
ncbi:MAG: LytR C-terminal domain-containing protein [Sphingomonadaceae bacterium]